MNDVESIVETASGNNLEAKAFLYAWHRYCHLIDDVVDGDEPPARAAQIGRWANDSYSSPFYQRYALVLGPQVQLITCHYEDSVEMENSKEKWKREVADVIRSNGADMVRMVAFLVGGYSLMRHISIPLREMCWREHHTIEGAPK